MKKIALINVGGNKKNLCRGPIFEDGSFIFLPILEKKKIANKKKFPSYESLNLNEFIPEKYHKSFVHYDPHFPSLTYGHITRGFGYETIIKSLANGDILLFYATLSYKGDTKPKYKWIHEDWGTYIIGSYIIEKFFTNKEFKRLTNTEQKKLENNPHYLRKKRSADYWISGNKKSLGLFKKAFPLHDELNNKKGNSFLSENFSTSSGKQAGGVGY